MNIGLSTPGRWSLVAAVATWSGVVIGFTSARLGVGVFAVVLSIALMRRRTVIVVAALFFGAGALSGIVAGMRTAAIEHAAIPQGQVTLTVRVAEGAAAHSYGRVVVEPRSINGIPWQGPRLAVIGLDPTTATGSTLTLSGELTARVFRVRDELVAGVLRVDEVVAERASTNPIVRIGNSIRGRVISVYDGSSPTDGLVRGLLIGDTDQLAASDEEDLRRAGLAHYIAVSGSNVALFLLAWWFLTAPISVRRVPRVVGGIIALTVFAVVTRWEPSVIRASVMAAVPLVGALLGIPFDPWMALGVAVTLLLLVSGHLAFSVGFQLSVAATAGVLIGVVAASQRRPRWFFIPLFVTVAAQIAVAPIILAVFGTIPLMAPVANLIVAPIVMITTALGAVAVVVPLVKPLVTLGGSAILGVAGIAASGPQLGIVAAVGAVLVGVSVVGRRTRPIGLAATALMLMWAMAAPSAWPTVPTMVVLDIGQGDAILLQDPSGEVVLIDGGADPRELDRALRRNGVTHLSLVVVTHGDQDHAGGVVELLASGRADRLWIPEFAPRGTFLDDAIRAAHSGGVQVRSVGEGDRFTTESIRIDILGPRRRYAGENDGSIVLWIGAGRTAFVGGDVGAVAQRELPPVRADVLVVPHHGSGATDLAWLERTAGGVAVLSYGVNRYGHPNPEVVATLTEAGVEVRHTHLEGDIVIPLTAAP